MWIADRCAVGEPGVPGCRSCVEACPYFAIRALDRPGGTVIDIDPELCQRCGACTGACPTSALERSFAPDAELRDAIDAALESGPAGRTLVFTCASGETQIAGEQHSFVFVQLPSLLILNETHFLYALHCGAARVIAAGCLECHHGEPETIAARTRLAGALAGDTSSVAYADERELCGTASTRIEPSRGHSCTPPAIPAHATRRNALLAVLGESIIPFDDREAPFADVSVRDDACTLCSACAQVCPTQALRHDPAEAALTFRQSDCVNCGLCESVCPTRAIDITPGLTGLDGFHERRTLVEDETVPCAECGEPFIAARLHAHARKMLAESGRLSEYEAQIDVCGACRSVHRPAPAGSVNRRSFLAASASAAVAAFGTRPSQAATSSARLGMVIDMDRCIGCHACTAACKAENDVTLGVFRDWVEEHVLGEYPHAKPKFLPKLCNHCDNPGCMRACPTGAIYKRPDGIVKLDHDLCIGCRACNQACPYGAAFMDPVRGVSDKCDLCAHRVDDGFQPACVDVCPPRCRIFGDLDDPDSAPSQALRDGAPSVLYPGLGLGPNVIYLGLPGELNR